MFRQLEGVNVDEGGDRVSVGLGLAITARMLRAMRGRILISSTLGGGTTVTIVVPLRRVGDPEPSDQGTPDVPSAPFGLEQLIRAVERTHLSPPRAGTPSTTRSDVEDGSTSIALKTPATASRRPSITPLTRPPSVHLQQMSDPEIPRSTKLKSPSRLARTPSSPLPSESATSESQSPESLASLRVLVVEVSHYLSVLEGETSRR